MINSKCSLKKDVFLVKVFWGIYHQSECQGAYQYCISSMNLQERAFLEIKKVHRKYSNVERHIAKLAKVCFFAQVFFFFSNKDSEFIPKQSFLLRIANGKPLSKIKVNVSIDSILYEFSTGLGTRMRFRIVWGMHTQCGAWHWEWRKAS